MSCKFDVLNQLIILQGSLSEYVGTIVGTIEINNLTCRSIIMSMVGTTIPNNISSPPYQFTLIEI